MRRYFNHIKTKEPHERRKHAMHLSGVFVGALFVLWVATFSMRIAAPPQSGDIDPLQTAAVANATSLDQSQARLEVSTTSVYSY